MSSLRQFVRDFRGADFNNRRDWLYANGQAAEGTVVAVERVGNYQDPSGSRLHRLRLRLLPIDGSPAVEGCRNLVMPPVFPPVPQVGDRLATFYKRDNPDRFVYVPRVFTDTPPHVRAVFDRCRTSPYPPVCYPARDRGRLKYRYHADRQPLFAQGQPALATILDVSEDVALVIGSRVWVDVSLAPLDGSDPVPARALIPFEDLIVSWLASPFAAYYDPDQPSRFTLVTAEDADVPAHALELHRRLRTGPPADDRTLPALMDYMVVMGQRREAWLAGEMTKKEYDKLFESSFPYR